MSTWINKNYNFVEEKFSFDVICICLNNHAKFWLTWIRWTENHFIVATYGQDVEFVNVIFCL